MRTIVRFAYILPLLLASGVASPATAQGNAPVFPEWRPTEAGWTTAAGAPLVATDGSAATNADLAGVTYQRIGRLWHTLEPTAANGKNASWTWPGGIAREPWRSNDAQRFGSASIGQGAVVGARNWQAASGSDQLAFTYITNEAFRFSADGGEELYEGDPTTVSIYENLENAQVQRWLPPQVIVNGIRYNAQTDTYGSEPGSPAAGDGAANFGAVRGVIDPNLVSERMVFSAWRFPIGVDVFQQVHAYSSGTDADYLLYDYHIVNTGNIDYTSGTERSAILDDFRYAFAFGADVNRMGDYFDGGQDDVVEYIEPWPSYTTGGGVGKTFALAYDGDGTEVSGPDWGAPGGTRLSDGTEIEVPRLWAPAALMAGWLYADTTPGSGVDDPGQPRSAVWADESSYRISELDGDMQDQYQRIFAGEDFDPGFSASVDTTTYRIPTGVTQRSMGITGFRPSVYQTLAYNSLDAGSTLHAVLAVAAGGINDSLNLSIANKVALRTLDSGVPASDRMTDAEIALVQSNRDSVLKTADRAFWAVYGYDPEGRNGWLQKPAGQDAAFNVPDPPKPPGCVWVTSGVNRIELAWTDDAEALPDHDTGLDDFGGYRIYRSDGSPNATVELIADLPAGTTTYTDSAVSADFPYWYAVTTYDTGAQNWENPGVSLESGRFWAWTGWYDQGVRPGGEVVPADADLANIRVVPNPYHADAARPAGTRSGELVWKNVPTPCTIRIFTAAGQFVHQIDAAEATSGNGIVWDLNTEWGQEIVPGVYIYAVECDAGTKVGKFVVVR